MFVNIWEEGKITCNILLVEFFFWGSPGVNQQKNMENSPPRKPFETCFHGGFSIYYVFGPAGSLAWDVLRCLSRSAGLSENGVPKKIHW